MDEAVTGKLPLPRTAGAWLGLAVDGAELVGTREGCRVGDVVVGRSEGVLEGLSDVGDREGTLLGQTLGTIVGVVLGD